MISNIGTVFQFTLLRYFLIAGVPFLIFYVFFRRRLNRNKIQQHKAGSRDFTREVFFSVMSSLLMSAEVAVVLFTPLRHHTLIYRHLHDYPIWWIPVSLFISLIIHDTYFYWMHRAMHHPSLFRFVHLVHHRSVNPSPWASYSFHFLEAVTEGGIVFVLVFILPMNVLTLLFFTVVSFSINVYGHLGYELMPRRLHGSWLFRVINTSVYHNLHHSKFNGNYSLYFRHWDRWMGTENPGYEAEYQRVQDQRFGCDPVR